jgi:catechol 2,3-dioxygenase-like lactoylglutathione lyase family enzyme
MIRGLFETHINVTDLDRSTAFYGELLGLALGYDDAARRARFFWIGAPGEAMLGLWEKPPREVSSQHVAFRASVDDVRQRAVSWLSERGLRPYNFLKDGTTRPMVFAWMPALAIYFDDPDGHVLELIAMLEGEPRAEAGVLSWEDWQKMQKGNR